MTRQCTYQCLMVFTAASVLAPGCISSDREITLRIGPTSGSVLSPTLPTDASVANIGGNTTEKRTPPPPLVGNLKRATIVQVSATQDGEDLPLQPTPHPMKSTIQPGIQNAEITKPKILSVAAVVKQVQEDFSQPKVAQPQNQVIVALKPQGDMEEVIVEQPSTPEELAFPNPTPIDLGSALQIATGENPQVAFTQFRIQEAIAQLRSAEVLWIPSLRAGFNYNKHEGRIQDVSGRIIETSRGSIYTGLGSQTVGAGSPAVPGLLMKFHTTDAIFQPKIAGQVVGASQQASQATINDTLLETALAYTSLIEAVQILAVADETHQNVNQLANLTADYARTGQGLQADADRLQTELSIREVELLRAREAVRVASVRLAPDQA